MDKFSEVNFLEIDENTEYIELIEKVIGKAFGAEKIDKLNLYINVILTMFGILLISIFICSSNF